LPAGALYDARRGVYYAKPALRGWLHVNLVRGVADRVPAAGGPRARSLAEHSQAHLRRILREYETRHDQHRPHRPLDSAAPLKPLPERVDLEQYRIRRHARVTGMINEYRLVA
jgi:hypothetical protein